jgi:hypothetical protein
VGAGGAIEAAEALFAADPTYSQGAVNCEVFSPTVCVAALILIAAVFGFRRIQAHMTSHGHSRKPWTSTIFSTLTW